MEQAKIEIYSRDVINTDLVGEIKDNIASLLRQDKTGTPQHLYIIHTNSNKEQTILRSGPENNKMLADDLKVIRSSYKKEYEHLFPGDFVANAHSLTIASGSDAEMDALMDKMWKRAEEINSGNYDYKLPTPFCPESVCHVQNSNTVVREVVEYAGLEFKAPEVNGKTVWAPGVNGELKHTAFDRYTKTSPVITESFEITNKFEETKIASTSSSTFDKIGGTFGRFFDSVADYTEDALRYFSGNQFGYGAKVWNVDTTAYREISIPLP